MSQGIVNVSTGVQSTQTQQIDQTQETATRNGHTIRAGGAKNIKRAVSEAFSKIGKGFKSLGNRISRANAERVNKVRTQAANNACKKVVTYIGKGNVSPAKLTALLSNAVSKATKLDPTNPGRLAGEMLANHLDSLSTKGATAFAALDFHQLSQGVHEALERNREQANRLGEAIANHPLVGGDQTFTPTTGPTAFDHNVRTVFNHLREAAAHSGLQQLGTALDSYLGEPNMKVPLLFRGNCAETKTIKHLLIQAMPRDYMTSVENDTMHICRELTANHNFPMLSGGRLDRANMTPEQMAAVLTATEQLMRSFLGGPTPESVQEAARRLPEDAVRVLQLVDQKVGQRFPGNTDATDAAFAGSLFLRFISTGMGQAQAKMEGADRGVAGLIGQLAIHMVNQPPEGEIRTKTRDLPPALQQMYVDFVATFETAIPVFRQAVMAREVG